MNNNFKPKFNNTNRNQNNVISIIVSVIVIIVLVYIITMTIKYILTPCYKRKNYFVYLFSFCWNQVCENNLESVSTINHYAMPKENAVEKVVDEVEEIFEPDQVFHISNQDYTYEQAKCKCNSYGSRLATKEEITKAYNNGADWCSYGWSEGQTAYYPTQKCSWDKLQKGNPKDKNSCGKPGVNGGFFPNPYLKFGANCFGKKPKGEVVKEKKPFCSLKNFCSLSNNYASSHKLPSDDIAPFNSDQWNE